MRKRDKSNLEIAEQNEENCLLLVDRFGWLRPQEIGASLFPASSWPRTAASRIIARLVSRGELVRRDTGSAGGGSHLIVGAAGHRRLIAAGLPAGQRQGELPLKWKHDLIAAQIMIARKVPFLTERECRRHVGQERKLPDGLISDGEGGWVWLEVERHRKKKDAHRILVNWIAAAARGFVWRSLQITGAVVVCPDKRGRGHDARLADALGIHLTDSEKITVEIVKGWQEAGGTWHTTCVEAREFGVNWSAKARESWLVTEKSKAGGAGTVEFRGTVFNWSWGATEEEDGVLYFAEVDGELIGFDDPDQIQNIVIASLESKARTLDDDLDDCDYDDL